MVLYLRVGIEITITRGPQNITAFVGDSVTLPCQYTGTNNQPQWRIGQTAYSSSNLPAGYEFTNGGLHIPSVGAWLNNTIFICFFTVHVGGGKFDNINSIPAIITVKIRCKLLWLNHVYTHTEDIA